MNKNQKAIIVMSLTALAAMFVYSPRHYNGHSCGYHFFSETWWDRYPIDTHMMLFQIFILGIVTTAMLLLYKAEKNS